MCKGDVSATAVAPLACPKKSSTFADEAKLGLKAPYAHVTLRKIATQRLCFIFSSLDLSCKQLQKVRRFLQRNLAPSSCGQEPRYSRCSCNSPAHRSAAPLLVISSGAPRSASWWVSRQQRTSTDHHHHHLFLKEGQPPHNGDDELLLLTW